MFGISVTSIHPFLLKFTYSSASLVFPQRKSFPEPIFFLQFSLFSSLQPCSRSPSILSLFSRNQSPDIVSLICSKLKEKTPHSLVEKERLRRHLGPREISKVLLRCQSEPHTAVIFFNWVKNELGLKPDTRNYSILIHILAWSRNFTKAMSSLSELIDISRNVNIFYNLVSATNGCNSNAVVFDMLTKAYVKKGMVNEGLETFRKMVEIGFVPDVNACNCLLNGLLKSKSFELCWVVYDQLGRIGVSPNSYTFNILTHVLCQDGDVVKVREFLEKMEDEGFEADLVTYNTLLDSYCRKGKLNDAFNLYKVMYRRGFAPNLVSYTVLVNGLCKEGKVKEAHQLFHRMIHRGLNPDKFMYNALISGYCKEGNLQHSRSLLHEMVGIGLVPDSFTCIVLIEGYKKHGQLLSPLNLIVQLRRSGVPISTEIYSYLISSLCEENKPYAAKNLLNRMFQDGHETNLNTYNALIEAFCKCDDMEEAFVLKDEMTCKGIMPDLTTYRALISSLCRLSKTVDGECLTKEMVGSGIKPDSIICAELVNGYCREKDLNKAELLLSYFAGKFQIFDTASYNTLIKVYCEEGNVTKSLELQDRMLKLGFLPNSLTCKSLINGLSRTRAHA